MCNGHIEPEVKETCEFEINVSAAPPFLPFEVVLDFKRKKGLHTEYIADKSLLDYSCGSDAVLDPYTNICHQLSCANGYVVSKTDFSRCTPVINDTIKQPEYVNTLNVQLQMVPTKTTRMVSDELTFLAEKAVSDLI
ncbi:hypothetical protein DPMN_187659 [Dreissena polymorpha]|uniref:Uncharacterized protein n=1 Tax=Dreissena polymorpha TaxID=45954 RepID=A0A9D4DPH3_DREPO|nr:hypothetical protein DPMN_187659 [Dreissena polymorpha]